MVPLGYPGNWDAAGQSRFGNMLPLVILLSNPRY